MKGANYMPMACREQKCQHQYLTDDIDINNHVNNAVYPLWATESVGTNWREKHTPKRIELWFKKEALYGQTIRVLSKFAGDTSIHSITDNEKENELARCNIDWRKI